MRIFYYTFIFVSLVGCQVLNRNPPSEPVINPPAESGVSGNSQVSGVVQLGPVQGAKVEVFLVGPLGQIGQKIFETFTNSFGEYTLTLPSGTDNILIVSTGGTYLDEADQQLKTAPELSNLVDASLSATASLSPISTLLTKRALSLVEDQAFSIPDARELAKGEVATLFGLAEEEVDALPTNPFDQNASSNTNAASVKMSLALASFSHFLKTNYPVVPLSDVLKSMEDDFVTDGQLDEPNTSTVAGQIAEQWTQKMLEAKESALANEALIFKDLPSSQDLANSMNFHPNTKNTKPDAPTSVSGTAGNGQVTLSWSAPSNDGGSAITAYVVQYKLASAGEGSWVTISDGTSTSTSATVTSLTNGSAYVFRVAAVNSVGTGSYSSASNGVTPVAPTPVITINTQPSNKTASSGSASFSVSASVTESATLSYQWQKQEGGAGDFSNVSGATSATLSLSSLTNAADNGDVYRVVVSATGGASNVTSSSATLTVAASGGAVACSGDCYSDSAATTAGLAQGPDGVTMEYVFANGIDGFKVWREQNGNRILNSTGLIANGWQKALTRAGTAFDGDFTSSTYIGKIAGRVCPPNVFLDHNNMTAENRCLFYDSGHPGQRLDADSGTLGEDYLLGWNESSSGRGEASSYYEGNIKTCADLGMRLPTMYETTLSQQWWDELVQEQLAMSLPTGDLIQNGGSLGGYPIWAGSADGVPHYSAESITASAYYHQYDPPSVYWVWRENHVNSGGFFDASHEFRCVLPSHGVAE